MNRRAAVPLLIKRLSDSSRSVFTESRSGLEALVQPEDRGLIERATKNLGPLLRRGMKALFAVLAEREGKSN